MIERIVVPLDGSPRAEQALPVAEELAQRLGVELHLLRAITTVSEALRDAAPRGTVTGSDASVEFALSVAEDRVQHEADLGRLYLATQVQRLEAAGLRVTEDVRQGQAALVIMEYAREVNASLIVMATHGRSGLSRVIYGSVADAVLRESDTPVLLVRVKG